jgi:hypothetical protein
MSLDSRPTGIDWHGGGGTGTVRWGEDTNLLVMFYNKSVHVATEEGRPIHKDAIFIKIQHPGETLNIIDRPVNDSDKQRFRTQWSNFVHDRTQVPEGTPIDLLFPNHPAVADNLRGFGVFTIEQCAGLSATAIDTIGRGAQEYKTRAQRYLDMANKGQSFHVLQKQIELKDQEVRIMQQTINSLKSQLESLTIKLVDPVRASLQPPHMANVDVQAERINANAPTKELTDKIQRRRNRKSSIEDTITDPFAAPANNPDIMSIDGQD